jgi:hypothetical protein
LQRNILLFVFTVGHIYINRSRKTAPLQDRNLGVKNLESRRKTEEFEGDAKECSVSFRYH